jgi:hypothetical protein
MTIASSKVSAPRERKAVSRFRPHQTPGASGSFPVRTSAGSGSGREEGNHGGRRRQRGLGAVIHHHDPSLPDLRTPCQVEDSADVGALGSLDGAGAALLAGSHHLLTIGNPDSAKVLAAGEPVSVVESLPASRLGEETLHPAIERYPGPEQCRVPVQFRGSAAESFGDEVPQLLAGAGDLRLVQLLCGRDRNHRDLIGPDLEDPLLAAGRDALEGRLGDAPGRGHGHGDPEAPDLRGHDLVTRERKVLLEEPGKLLEEEAVVGLLVPECRSQVAHHSSSQSHPSSRTASASRFIA